LSEPPITATFKFLFLANLSRIGKISFPVTLLTFSLYLSLMRLVIPFPSGKFKYEFKQIFLKEPSAKEKAATKIVKKIDDKERYDDAAQMKTLIVMQILGNTKTFFDTQSTIVDTDVNEYLNKTIEDNYGVLFNMAQAQTIEEMINAQY
jgi:hypothetical protein